MPIYEYKCPKCGENFELMRRFSEMDEPAKCPKCGTKAERVEISHVAFDHTKTWQMTVGRDKKALK